MSVAADSKIAAPAKSRTSRRSWSRAEKCEIVEKAFHPGASVADIARRHGLNANQVFNWRRRMQARAAAKAAPPVTPVGGFVPVGVIAPSTDVATAVLLAAPSMEISAPAARASRTTDERAGVIEIDLACGTRLLVDGLVREQALRRVLSALKATA